ncbi:hypothetical protein F4805DRAFT_457851 [Annulohypoxylon moriforme]|nr:hypothetical protein F4805DRAFT_457851 [Annulohypoxylon moriforme]
MDKKGNNSHPSSKTKESKRATHDDSAKDNYFPIDRYLNESNRHEQIAIGQPSDQSATEKELRRIEQMLEAASKRSG